MAEQRNNHLLICWCIVRQFEIIIIAALEIIERDFHCRNETRLNQPWNSLLFPGIEHALQTTPISLGLKKKL